MIFIYDTEVSANHSFGLILLLTSNMNITTQSNTFFMQINDCYIPFLKMLFQAQIHAIKKKVAIKEILKRDVTTDEAREIVEVVSSDNHVKGKKK